MAALLGLFPTEGVVVAMGDFNAQLVDLRAVIDASDTSGFHSWRAYTAENVSSTSTIAGMPVNRSADDSKMRYYFTTQHENNFIAAYDGYLIRDRPGRGLFSSVSAHVNESGFMPKYLGMSKGDSAFSYSDGAYPVITGDLMLSSSFYSPTLNSTMTSVTDLKPTNSATKSLSDHLSVSIKLDW